MISEMQLDDVKEVVRIEKDNFTLPYEEKQYLYEIEDNLCAQLYVLKEEDVIVGYIDFWVTFESCQLCKIAVDKNYQGKGYGKQLMEFMFDKVKDECETIFLEVRESNQRARAFYEGFDFWEINVRKNYYSDPIEDGIIMGKILVGE